jgi:hypothetical protein
MRPEPVPGWSHRYGAVTWRYAMFTPAILLWSGHDPAGIWAVLSPHWPHIGVVFFPRNASVASKPKKGGQPGPQTTMKGSNMNVPIDAVLYFLWWIIIHLIPQASKFTPQVSNFLSGLR